MKLTHISHGFYRVSDTDAGRLAEWTRPDFPKRAQLPRLGHELNVRMPEGEPAVLTRTRVEHSARGFTPPSRGWVWSVRSSSDLSRYARDRKARANSRQARPNSLDALPAAKKIRAHAERVKKGRPASEHDAIENRTLVALRALWKIEDPNAS